MPLSHSTVKIAMIANQMMKGPQGGRYAANSTEKERAKFLADNREMIEKLLPLLPRGSGAIGAAIAKCALRYDKDRAFEFAKKVKDGMFEGKTDPVFLLWRWLNGKKNSRKKTKREKTIDIYRMTATACVAYCECRILTDIRPKETDIFEWDKYWQVPEKYRRKDY
jgi:hypothetical protein